MKKRLRFASAVLLMLLLIPVLTGGVAGAMAADAKADSDRRSELIQALFAAAAGTTAKEEEEARYALTYDEIDQRNAMHAEYRRQTMPWLLKVFSASPPDQTHLDTPEIESANGYTCADSYQTFTQTDTGRHYLSLMAEQGADSMEACLQRTQELCAQWMDEIDHARLAEMNSDYICWIYAPDTQIDYPIVQSGNNADYLKRLFNGDHNSAGTLFMDYRNLPDFQDPNTLIYGHHMRNGSMFGTLTHYETQGYFDAHPLMLVMTPESRFFLTFFAGYTTSSQDHCYDIAISDERDMQAFLDEALAKSDFHAGTVPLATDRLVTLSTCAYAFEGARYILIGQIVPIECISPSDAAVPSPS